jgi:catechol 2,3-dioxygenase-like lactoylglutathione lyase family enzyme
MVSSIRHIALTVPDLQEAEAYYQALLGMELLGRETQLGDGQWYQLPLDKGWEEAGAAGIELRMLALRKGAIVLALFSGGETRGQVFAIGLTLSQEEIDEVRTRLSKDILILMDQGTRLHFIDHYGIMWQLELPGVEFRMNGESSGRWLEL